MHLLSSARGAVCATGVVASPSEVVHRAIARERLILGVMLMFPVNRGSLYEKRVTERCSRLWRILLNF